MWRMLKVGYFGSMRFVFPHFVLRILLLLVLPVAGCVSPIKGLYPAPRGEQPVTVYVLHRGLHTGVIVRAADIPSGVWPEHEEFPNAKYLEVGWGDSDGYRYPWTTRLVLRALFDSKGSVVLVHAFNGPVVKEYTGIAKEIIAVQLSPAGFARLCAYVQSTYALDSRGRAIPLTSIYAGQDFFLATGHYSLLDNCNTWTARALRTAGCPIAPHCCPLPGLVMSNTRHFGQVIWRRSRLVSSRRFVGGFADGQVRGHDDVGEAFVFFAEVF
jgi:uncharacterized protein (TIGR02117 family)